MFQEFLQKIPEIFNLLNESDVHVYFEYTAYELKKHR
jgi:hypothetical protein